MPGFKIGGKGSGPNAAVEFHRAHRWKIESLGIPQGGESGPGGGSAGGTRTRGASSGGPAGVAALALYAHSLQLPSLTFEEEKIKSASVVYKVAKRANWKNCVVKFYDVYGLYKEFDKWQKKIWDQQKGIQAAVGYKGEPKFVLVDGAGNPKQRYILRGAYPVDISHGELSYTNSEVKLLVVTYSYDFADISLMDEQSTQQPDRGGTRTRSGGDPPNQGINSPNS